MSKFFTPRNLAIAGGVGAAIFLFPRTRKTVNPVGEGNSNAFETPGAKNVGGRYATQGGTETHLPGVATPRGSAEKQIPPQDNLNGTTSGKFQNRVADQKQDPNPVGAALGKATLGSAHGTTAAKLIKTVAPGSLVESLQPITKPSSSSFEAHKQDAEHPGTEELHHTQNGGEHHEVKGKKKHAASDKALSGKHDKAVHR